MNNKQKSLGIIVAAAIFFMFFFGNQLFYVIDPGEKAVIFKPFGGGLVKDQIMEEGFHTKAPWNKVHIYYVKEQKREENMDVLDKNGLTLAVDISVRFNPVYDKVGYLHERFGIDYIDQLVIPEVRSAVRQVAGRFTAEEIYSTKRSAVESQIIEEAKKSLDQNNVDMRALLIRSITLPIQIKNSIESKLQQEQEALAYEFRLQREQSEAERKKIEAEGIAVYNDIINRSLTENILLQKGIDATIELSKSPNSKVIVVGSGDNGLPLILGNQ